MIASTSFRALGTTATIVTNAGTLAESRELLARELALVDAACSRFRPDSELSRVNERAGQRVAISARLADAVETAIQAAKSTGGLVTPTLGTPLRRAGYDRTFELVRTRGTWAVRSIAAQRDEWHDVELDTAQRTLRVPRGVELDLGATAKALAADRSAASIAAATGTGVLVSLGGDIAVAGSGPVGGWIVRVAEDHQAALDTAGPVVALTAGGLATSSTTLRRWPTDGGEAHHVIDPNTGRPANTPWRTVSASAASCVEANVAALGALLVGTDATRWLHARKVHARLVRQDGAVAYAGAWPTDAEAA